MKSINMLAVAALSSCMLMAFAPTTATTNNTATEQRTTATILVSWEKDSYDFGTIEHAKPVTVNFTFTNNGDEPILVSDVATSCGCTASDYSKEPILPGKSSSVKVTYNASATGAFTKTITVNFSDPASKKVLLIKGTVK